MNKNQSRNETDADQIRGFDLKIDSSVKHVCEVYNATSGSTRSVIYVLMIINVMSIIAIINTSHWNWTNKRITISKNAVKDDEKKFTSLVFDYRHKKDSTTESFVKQNMLLKKQYGNNIKGSYDSFKKDSITLLKKYRTSLENKEKIYFGKRLTDSDEIYSDIDKKNSLIKNQIDNAHHVSIPLMGNSFDINDLSQVAGISLYLLLVILKFTLAREKDNLQIAFNSISERYYKDFVEFELPAGLETIIAEEIYSKDNFKELVNFKRRRYHYNSLSMNEIFNLPKLDVSPDILQTKRAGKFVKNHLFAVPFLVYLIIFINDISTAFKGYEISPLHTLVSLFFSYTWLTVISIQTTNCNSQKKDINKLFDEFYTNNYECERHVYMRAVDHEEKLTIFKRMFFSFVFIKRILSDVFMAKKRNIKKYIS